MNHVAKAPPRLRVCIIGGSYAGLSAAVNLVDLHRSLRPRQGREPYTHQPNLPDHEVEITIIDERDGFYHLIGSPMALADIEYAERIWVKFQAIPELQRSHIKFIHGTVAEVNCNDKKAVVIDSATKQRLTQSYDVLLTCSGLRRRWPVVPQAQTKSEFLTETKHHVTSLRDAPNGIVVVGGGAVGVEMAAKFKMLMPDLAVTLVHSRDKLLSSEPLPEETKEKILEILRETGVEVLMNHRLSAIADIKTSDGITKCCIEFTNGNKIMASKVMTAISRSVPSTKFLPASAVDSEGYVKVLPNLNFQPGTANHKDHFSAGDMIQWPGIKRCGGAMHMGQLVAQNIHQRIIEKLTGQQPAFKELENFPPMIAISIGKSAVAYTPYTGTTWGADVMQTYFGEDLAFSYCWDTMQLNVPLQNVKTEA